MKNSLFKFIRAIIAPSLFLGGILISTHAYSTNCMHVYGQSLDPHAWYDSNHKCYSCANQAALGSCDVINELLVRDTSAATNVLIAAHRGYWGFPLSKGAPENTMQALQKAISIGNVELLEIDVTKTLDDKLVLNHFFNLLGADTNGAGFLESENPRNLTLSQLKTINVDRRDGSKSTEKFASFEDALIYAKYSGAILMLDPKLDAGQDKKKDYANIVAIALEAARFHDALDNLVVKVYLTHAEIVSELNQSPHLHHNFADGYEGRFLWAPITSSGIKDKTQAETLTFIDTWWDNAHKQVSNWETNIYSPDWWGAKAFTSGDKSYDSLINYVNVKTNRRGSLWSLDPAGPRGTLSRVHKWKFIANTPNDERGDVFSTMNYPGASHALITTDRPDFYKQFKHYAHLGGN